jgi:hypothetical protein
MPLNWSSPSWVLALAIGKVVKLLGADSVAGSLRPLLECREALRTFVRTNVDAIHYSAVPSPVATGIQCFPPPHATGSV